MSIRVGDNVIAGTGQVINKVNANLVTLTDWNFFNPTSIFSFVQTTQGVTLNSPKDITANWFVQYVQYENNKLIIAIKADEPAQQYFRTFSNDNWSNWTYSHATWS